MNPAASRLPDDPSSGHNRWHEGVPPVLDVDPGDDVVLDTRDGFDGQVTRGMTPDDFAAVTFLANHAMTGPIRVRGARHVDPPRQPARRRAQRGISALLPLEVFTDGGEGLLAAIRSSGA